MRKLIACGLALLALILPASATAIAVAPVPGFYGKPIWVKLTGPEGSSIAYTLDDSMPTCASTPYAQPFKLTSSARVRAVACVDGVEQVSTQATYAVFHPVPPPQGFATVGQGVSMDFSGWSLCPVLLQGDLSDQDRLVQALRCPIEAGKGRVIFFIGKKVPIAWTRVLDLPNKTVMFGPVEFQNASARIRADHDIRLHDIVWKSTVTADCPVPTAITTTSKMIAGCNTPIHISGGVTGDSAENATNIWIDHNTFQGCGDKCIVVSNGPRNAQGQWTAGDLISISYNRCEDSFYCILVTDVGAGGQYDEEETPVDEPLCSDPFDKSCGLRAYMGYSRSTCERIRDEGLGDVQGFVPWMRVSVYGNLFNRVRRRSPRAAYCNSFIHAWNNYNRWWGLKASSFPATETCANNNFIQGHSASAAYGGSILHENNAMEAWPRDPRGCKGVGPGPDEGEDAGYFKGLASNLYLNGAFTQGDNYPEKVPFPPYAYSMIPADRVAAEIPKQAGARK